MPQPATRQLITIYPDQNGMLVSIVKADCHSRLNLQDRQAVLDVLKGRENHRGEGLRRELYETDSVILHETSINQTGSSVELRYYTKTCTVRWNRI
jgi:hypothetical protein